MEISIPWRASRLTRRQRKRWGGAVIACVALFLGACSFAAPNLAGIWKSERTTLTIVQDKSSYKIVADNPKGILGGNYTSEYHDGRLELKGPLAPLCGDMKYDEKAAKLNFCGEEFVRVSK